MTDEEITKTIDELVKNSDVVVATPDTIEKMQKKGAPVTSKIIPYSEYLDKLFAERRRYADSVVASLPHLHPKIANATIEALYEEMKECFVLGIPGATITLACILLELALKYRVYERRVKKNPKALWKRMEEVHFSDLVEELHEGTESERYLDEETYSALVSFNSKIRNNYIHYNIQKLIKGMFIAELPSVNVETGKVTIERDVDATKRPPLWFSAKRVLDKKTMLSIVDFCIALTNKLLTEE